MEQKIWDDYTKLSFKQQLNSIMNDLQNAYWTDELWSDSSADATTLSESFNNVTMHFDLDRGTVDVASESRNDKNQPMFEWQMTPATGEIL